MSAKMFITEDELNLLKLAVTEEQRLTERASLTSRLRSEYVKSILKSHSLSDTQLENAEIELRTGEIKIKKDEHKRKGGNAGGEV